MSKINSRTLCRIYAFKFLYQFQLSHSKDQYSKLINSQDIQTELNQLLSEFNESFLLFDDKYSEKDLIPSDKKFINSLIIGVLQSKDKLEKIISNSLKKWTIDRLDKIDLTILLIGTYELKYIEETPQKVVINEAINLAKSFGSKDSKSFVNGVIDSIAKSLKTKAGETI